MLEVVVLCTLYKSSLKNNVVGVKGVMVVGEWKRKRLERTGRGRIKEVRCVSNVNCFIEPAI